MTNEKKQHSGPIVAAIHSGQTNGVWVVRLPSASVQNLLMPGSHNRCSYDGSLFAFSLSGLHWGMLHWNWGPMFTWGVASDSGAESLLVVGPCWLSSEPDDSPPLPSARIWWCALFLQNVNPLNNEPCKICEFITVVPRCVKPVVSTCNTSNFIVGE